MAAYAGLLLCSLLWIFSSAEGNDLNITCVSSEDCVLPCQFQSDGKGARIMWYKKKAVVSCTRYGNTSFVVGHNSPADKYIGRTALYADQVLDGNATLVLRNVTPHDQGKYFCITYTEANTEQSGIISLVVKAPVQKVDMEFIGSSVTCRAEGIYPAPTLTWSTDPPVARLLQNKTKTQKNQLGFYDVQSSLRLMEDDAVNQTCICCVTTDSNKMTAFLKQEASIQASAGSDVNVPCSLPHNVLQSFNLTWMFRRSDPILSISIAVKKQSVKVWDQWRHHVSNGFSASRHLELRNLQPEHQGTYTCEVSTPEETYVTWTDVTVTEGSKEYIYIAVIVVLAYLLGLSYVVLAFLGFKIRRLTRAREQEGRRDEDADQVNVDGLNGENVEVEENEEDEENPDEENPDEENPDEENPDEGRDQTE